MPDEVETMFSVRELPWHGKGVLLEQAPDADEAIRLAGLDWEVEKRPVFTESGQEIEGYYATIRTSDGRPLGIVRDIYEVFQNRELFDLMDSLRDVGGVTFETAGSLRGGKQVWVLGRLPEEIHLGREHSPSKPYVLLLNSHDGTLAVRFGVTVVRVVCANTVQLALTQDGKSFVAVRHAKGMRARLEEAKHILGLSRESLEEFERKCELLAQMPMSGADAVRFVSEFFPIDAEMSQRQREHRLNNRLTLMNLFSAGPGQSDRKIQGSRLAMFNAVIDWIDHGTKLRSGDRISFSLLGNGARRKAKAFETLLSMPSSDGEGSLDELLAISNN